MRALRLRAVPPIGIGLQALTLPQRLSIQLTTQLYDSFQPECLIARIYQANHHPNHGVLSYRRMNFR